MYNEGFFEQWTSVKTEEVTLQAGEEWKLLCSKYPCQKDAEIEYFGNDTGNETLDA